MPDLQVRKIGLLTHEIAVLCLCPEGSADVETCTLEKYVSDVRIAAKVANDALARLARCTCGAAA